MGKAKLIVIGASFGGFEALDKILAHLPPTVPPIVTVVHAQPGVSKLYAARADKQFRISAKEAASGDFLTQGQMLIAPAGKHMRVISKQGRFAVDCYVGEKVEFVMPAADILFESVTAIAGKDSVGVILTGLGADGAKGLLKLRGAGAKTIGQDEKTSMVYGMPKVAYELGAVEFQLPIDRIASKILSLI